jgi:hypothetical protein
VLLNGVIQEEVYVR